MRSTAPPLLPLLLDAVPSALETMLAQEGVPAVRFQPGRSNGTFVLFDSRGSQYRGRREGPHLTLHQHAIDLDLVRRELARQGFRGDPFAEPTTSGTCRAAWRVGPWEASEEIAAVDRRDVRERVLGVIRAEIAKLRGVWLRVAPYPLPYRTVANFRFDHDEFVAGDFQRTLEAITGREAMTTHFVCGATHEAHREAVRKLAGLDVGSHGYRHHTYRTPEENQANIARGIETLRGCGIEPRGFAAPHGRYNAGLAAALNALGITHSSEFGLAADDVPFFPSGSDVLQLPIHPFCLGIVLEAAATDETTRAGVVEATIEHFLHAAAALHQANLPILLYGHPDGRVGRYPELLRRVLGAIEALPDVWRTTLSEFQHWWRLRARVELEVHADGDGWLVAADRLPARYACAIEIQDGDEVATIPLARTRTRIERGSLTFVARRPVDLPVPRRLPAVVDVRAMIRRALDWERVTPVDEIDTRRLTGLMKKTLRRIRG
jgi:hypothetical protein